MSIRSVSLSAVCYRHVQSACALGHVIAKIVNIKRVSGSIASGTARVNLPRRHMHMLFSICRIRFTVVSVGLASRLLYRHGLSLCHTRGQAAAVGCVRDLVVDASPVSRWLFDLGVTSFIMSTCSSEAHANRGTRPAKAHGVDWWVANAACTVVQQSQHTSLTSPQQLFGSSSMILRLSPQLRGLSPRWRALHTGFLGEPRQGSFLRFHRGNGCM